MLSEKIRMIFSDSFYEETERLFDQIPSFHIKTLLGNCNENRRRYIFKPMNFCLLDFFK